MNAHAKHTFLQIIVAVILLVMASVSARALDLSSYTGIQLYMRFCSSCHGDKARGDGPVANTFKIEVPDLTRIAHRHGGVFPTEIIHKIIDGRKTLPPHGSRAMPVWGFEIYREDENTGNADPQGRTDDLVARLTEYLRTIQIE
jgi:cytochrome c5